MECQVFESNCQYDVNYDFRLLEFNTSKFKDGPGICKEKNSDGCTFRFAFSKFEPTLELLIHTVNGEKQECPPVAQILGITAGILVLLFGVVAILIYFLYIQISDRREYAKFIRERDNFRGAINTNPLHKSPITRFENPMFEKKTD